MRIYVLEVSEEYFEYDEIVDAVVLCENKKQAIQLAKEKRDVDWEITGTHELNEIGLIASFIHYG